MYCEEHENMVVLWGFSKFTCEYCKEEKDCPHTPPNKICHECAELHEVCEKCGKFLGDKTELF